MTQERALDILKTGGNVFLTGEPGSGKTYVINQYIAYLEACKLRVAVTASTGIAATHIGGMTVHAWSGIGPRDTLNRYDLDHIVSQKRNIDRVQKAHVLIIDEVSMLDAKVIDMVNVVCKTIRHSDEAFGGLQVVFVGDFFQLPPIVRMGEQMRYAFESRGWEEAQPLVCYLGDQYRQDDELLMSLLQSIRRNEVEEEHFTLLQEQTEVGFEHIEPTKLYTHNVDVDAVNQAKLRALQGKIHTFTMEGRGNKQLQQQLAKHCLSPELLELKEEAMVMCTKNNFEVGYVNGTLGKVIGFDTEQGYPIIETADGRKLTIQPVTWTLSEDGKVLAEIEQVPLRLAWAITIHKSQGMSLDAAEIDLSKAFVFGQGYVALSRVRTLAGVKMLGMSPSALSVDPKIVMHDEQFRTNSDATDDAFEAMEETEVEDMHERFIKACGGVRVKGDIAVAHTKKFERIQKESTFAETKRLLQERKKIREIAKQRDMVESTIWSHIEKLAEDKSITLHEIEHLKPDVWSEAYPVLREALAVCGTDKLKPVYEYTGERYEYEVVRLARLVYLLS